MYLARRPYLLGLFAAECEAADMGTSTSKPEAVAPTRKRLLALSRSGESSDCCPHDLAPDKLMTMNGWMNVTLSSV